jgi:hypothetical protein
MFWNVDVGLDVTYKVGTILGLIVKWFHKSRNHLLLNQV